MENLLVIVDRLEDWNAFYPTDQVITAKDYLFSNKYQDLKSIHVLNFCNSFKYLSQGYYCSLLAEARGHKILPNVKTINGLSKKKFYKYNMDELQMAADKAVKKLIRGTEDKNELSFRIYLGRADNPIFQTLAKEIFETFPCPLLEVELHFENYWKVESIRTTGLRNLTDLAQDIFALALDGFSPKIWRRPKDSKQYLYDMAILVNPDEKLRPSDPKALSYFKRSCEQHGIYCEFITKKDLERISEFDALFIRETTAINNHTYLFAKRAAEEGLVVIDDPDSIIKCTNKIFIDYLLRKHHISTLPSKFISDTKPKTIKEIEDQFSYPVVLKIPDGSFSRGVKKAEDRESLERILKELLDETSLVFVQQYFYTHFDWRICVFAGKPLFACKYYMTKGHWQIYNHAKSCKNPSGAFETLPIEEVPKKVIEAATKAARLIGNGLYGVDLKSDAKNVYVIEINDNPNIDGGIEDKVIKKKLYDIIVEEFVERIKKQKNGAKTVSLEAAKPKPVYEQCSLLEIREANC